ncbi:MAG: maleylpyruvate isomerase family mycothiol-dependent enzyme [Actinomycetes bacterium]
MTAETRDLIRVLRALHDRLATFVVDLGPDQLRTRSFATEWMVADVLAHLGSGAELSMLRLGPGDDDGPSHEEMARVWATWDTRTPEQQAVEAIAADEAYVAVLEQLDDKGLADLRRERAGVDLDVTSTLRLRVAEHAVHGWDIAVAFDDGAVLPDPGVPVLLELLPVTLRFAAQPHEEQLRLRVTTTDPDRDLLLDLGRGEARIRQLTDDDAAAGVDGELALPAEALLRLVYGRLDPRHTPPVKSSDGGLLDRLRAIFRGF